MPDPTVPASPREAEQEAREQLVALLDQVRHSGCSCGLCGATTDVRVAYLDAYRSVVRAALLAEVRERVEKLREHQWQGPERWWTVYKRTDVLSALDALGG